MSNKLEATFGPSKAPSSPGVTKQARDLCGRDIGRRVTASVHPILGREGSVPFDGSLDKLEASHGGIWIGCSDGGAGWLDLDATVRITGTPAS